MVIWGVIHEATDVEDLPNDELHDLSGQSEREECLERAGLWEGEMDEDEDGDRTGEHLCCKPAPGEA
jgi:hypothetical protein